MVFSIILLTLTAIVVVLAAPLYLPFIASGFSAEKIELTRKLLQLLSPVIVLYGLNTVWGAVLNADRKFGLVAFTPMVTPLLILLLLLTGGRLWGIQTLEIGTVCGLLLEVSLLGAALKRRDFSLWQK
jgi:putative peptidoglycan lipid II flippase